MSSVRGERTSDSERKRDYRRKCERKETGRRRRSRKSTRRDNFGGKWKKMGGDENSVVMLGAAGEHTKNNIQTMIDARR